ncbi:hypothetical protein TcasGA2_TC005402 [Tribolium castaneum]|uniref:Uncharacterized protein n=1 Tax=Tribolium castaneum TaxID=7070 RepID=D6WZ12_TRICA|nr:hypothetical protein TcasGA2_TC005402 [Tribolium castaneum]
MAIRERSNWTQFVRDVADLCQLRPRLINSRCLEQRLHALVDVELERQSHGTPTTRTFTATRFKS